VKRLQVELSRRSVLSTLVDGECDKQVTVVGHQFVTLTVDICVQHGGCEALRRAGLSAAARLVELIGVDGIVKIGGQTVPNDGTREAETILREFRSCYWQNVIRCVSRPQTAFCIRNCKRRGGETGLVER